MFVVTVVELFVFVVAFLRYSEDCRSMYAFPLCFESCFLLCCVCLFCCILGSGPIGPPPPGVFIIVVVVVVFGLCCGCGFENDVLSTSA